MATTLESQLKTIRLLVQGDSSAPKRPITRPSILFDPKEAADIDLETIFSIAISGLNILIETDERFRCYKNTLFSQKSLDMDREVMTVEENNKINSSISSYLRLLSGYLQLPSAQKTLEYLIRRCKVHIYNVDELVMCILPYHDTHVFVGIVQILDLSKNKIWSFLQGVKSSGAPMPRKTIVQQCLRDVGVLEAVCSYVMPEKKFLHSQTVVCFCTALIVEIVGSMLSLDNNMVKRVLPLVFASLNSSIHSADYKAGAMMMVSVISSRAALAPGLVQDLIISLAKLAHQEAGEQGDLSWLHMSLMGIINIVQSQSVKMLPWRCVKVLKEIREVPAVLSNLLKEYNIDKFLCFYMDSLVHYCSSDDSCHLALIGLIERIPMTNFIIALVSKLLAICAKGSRKIIASHSPPESGFWAVKILLALDKQYPKELANAVHEFVEDTLRGLLVPFVWPINLAELEILAEHIATLAMHVQQNPNTKCGDAAFESAGLMFDLGPKLPMEVSNLKLWFTLEHPRAEVRRSALSDLAKAEKEKCNSKKITVNVRESLLRRLHDDDLTVVQSALTVDGLCGLIDPAVFIKALQDITLRCCNILKTGVTRFNAIAYDIAVSCLTRGVNELEKCKASHKEIATIFFPLLLVLPKTWKLNLRALELAKEVDWPFFKSLADNKDLETMKETKKLEIVASSVNVETITVLSQNFTRHPARYIPWLMECCLVCELSKPFVLMIMLRSFMMQKKATRTAHFLGLFEACFPVLKSEWLVVEANSVAILAEEVKLGELDNIFSEYNIYWQIESKSEVVNANLIVSICWVLLETFHMWVHGDDKAKSQQYDHVFEDLFIFFATSQSKGLFKEHLRLLVTSCSLDPVLCLSNFYSDERFPVPVQVESLNLLATLFSTLASTTEITVQNINFSSLQLAFPSVLVPLASAEQAVRAAAVDYVERLYKLWCHIRTSSKQNGNKIMLDDGFFLHSCWEVLELIMQQKKMICLDQNFFQLFMQSLLSSRSDLLVPQDLDRRFDQDKKAEIMHFILRTAVNLPHHGKFVLLSMLKGVGNRLLFVEETKLLLSDLLRRRSLYFFGPLNHEQKLLEVETGILCVLLEGWSSVLCPSKEDVICENIFKALKVDNTCKELVIVKPCLAVLRSLTSDFYDGLRTELQDELFQRLVNLARNENADIQKAAKDVLMKVHVTSLTINRQLNLVQGHMKFHSCDASKKLKLQKQYDLNLFASEEGILHFLFSLFDVLLLKKNLENRSSVIEVLIELLYKTSDSEWTSGVTSECNICYGARARLDGTTPVDLIYHIQQAILSVLDDIAASLLSDPLLEKPFHKDINVDLLIKFMHRVEERTTRNQAFTLITSLTKLVPSHILPQMIDICTMAGESTIKQDDTHSQSVIENVISTLVPAWLSTSNDVEKLLQIFIEVLPQVSEGRRITLVTCLLRALGESKSLGLLLVLLVRSLVKRMGRNLSTEDVSSLLFVEAEWEYIFADQICLQYSCTVWLPSFLNLLSNIGTDNFSLQKASELQVAMRFILHKMGDTELMFKVEAGHDSDNVQGMFSAVMEHVILHSQTSDLRMKKLRFPTTLRKELRRSTQLLLHSLMKYMVPSAFFMGITKLVRHVEGNLRKKALELLCEYVKGDVLASKKPKTRKQTKHLIASDLETDGYFNDMSREIIQLVDTASDCSVKLAAISAVEALSDKYPCDSSILLSCLSSVSKQIGSESMAISAGCLRSTGTLISKLGVDALPLLPSVMPQVLERARDVTSTHNNATGDKNLTQSEISYGTSLLLSVLTTLEALVVSVGGFLNPYLQDIIELLVFMSAPDHKIKQQASTVREVLCEKISVRLILSPLMKIYPAAVNHGELSVSITFKMIASLISKMDRTSVGTYHAKIFEQCLVALDLRRRHPVSLKDVNTVEESVINAMVVLTMKLTEGLFKPAFCKTLEWADSELEEGSTGRKNIDRNIAFYKLVNKLAETHRSLFVPYFKYLTESCIHHLTDAEEQSSVSATQKRKKTKLRNSNQSGGDLKQLSSGQWHLRALVISSLHKCFLYDTGNLKFLDSSNFQALLKPLVSQLVVDLPALCDQNLVMPTVEEVDDLLVSCLGQMALTAGTDLLWKPLNHEVLMQTRSEKLRPRVLGLRVVKYLLDHLKEEYLVFLPETIPFLGELLEDADLEVKSLAQDILREMEKLSGENLRQYL